MHCRWLMRPGALAAVLLALGGGCSRREARPPVPACPSFDRLLSAAFLPKPFAWSGRAKFDFQQKRLEGVFNLTGTDSTLRFDFTASVLLGAHREDFSVVLTRDRIVLFDRERGGVWLGEDARAVVRDSLGVEVDLAGLISLALGSPPPCQELAGLERRERGSRVTFRGKAGQGWFDVTLSGARWRLERIDWPVALVRRGRDKLTIEYRWREGRPGGLDEITIKLERKGWRIQLRGKEV